MTKRPAITVEQQFWWVSKYEKAVDFLRNKNIGTCRDTGKTFGEIFQYFIIGSGETCIMACAGGSMKIIG